MINKKLLDGLTEAEFITFVREEYTARREERKAYDLQWQLNMNFVAGNQYCVVTPRGDIAETVKEYDWQQREVYNHLAPILETRLAKLSRVRPKMAVIPAGSDDNDIYTAQASGTVLASVSDRIKLAELIAQATMWSETCGTVFYKVDWDQDEVAVNVVSPFELYPDTSAVEAPDDCQSLIHARAVPVRMLEDLYDVTVPGESVCVFCTDGMLAGGMSKLLQTKRKDYAVLTEYYERPSRKFVGGRYAILAGDRLIRLTEMPYRNGTDGTIAYPFVKQVSVAQPGCLWGASVIERAIPVQRAYNAVKNRKHEFLNRLAGGVLTVEDGSLDTDELAMDGLNPGKILVYRQGASAPRFLDTGHLPSEFSQEEDKLLAEFIAVSGVSEIMRSSTTSHSVNSGVALQLLIEQDDTRLAVTAELVKRSVLRVAAQILRLYKQFATGKRMARVIGKDGSVECQYWQASDITSDDVVFVTENEISSTPAQKQQLVFDLLKTGLLADENGRMSDHNRTQLLETLGFGMWQRSKDTERLQIKRAAEEQRAAAEKTPVVKVIDHHGLHLEEHIRYMLSGEFAEKVKDNPKLEQIMTEHVEIHRANLQKEGENNQHEEE